MKIDYSVPYYTKFYGCLDANLRYGTRHLELAARMGVLNLITGVSLVPLSEMISHAALGVLELVPGIGHAFSLFDYAFNSKEIILRLQSTDPYKQGLEQGKAFQSEMKTMCQMAKIIGRNPKLKEYENRLSRDHIEELKGMAKGANLSYEELLAGNATIEKMIACSLIALETQTSDGKTNSLTATNHFTTKHKPKGQCPGIGDSTFERNQALQNQPLVNSVSNCMRALLAANYYDTVQSIVFDINKRDIHLATASGYAANRSFRHIRANELFGPSKGHEDSTPEKTVKLARNLDWPIPILGPETVVVVRPSTSSKKSTAVIGWPGMLGAFSGMNEEGLSLAISIDLLGSRSTSERGTPNQLLFRNILENSSTTDDAEDEVGGTQISTSMNLIVAAKDGIVKMELDPHRYSFGSSKTTRT